VETEDIDICQIAAEVAEEFEDSCRERGILFDRKNITAEKTLIHGNAEQVRIVFNNLLNNAVQALSVLERDKKRISLSVLPSGSGVEIIIEDNGSGIPDNIRGNIFKMFFSTKEGRGEGGLGMGLAIARWVVEDCHKGRIRVESKVGEFTRFVIRLPVA
jgi:signal transduction histidine kinase